MIPGREPNHNTNASARIVKSETGTAPRSCPWRASESELVQDVWTPGINYAPITSPDGVGNSTMLGFVRTRGRAISGSFNPYFNGSALPDWYTSDSGRTNLAMFQQIGGSLTSGGLMLLSAPTVQITTPQAADNGGISGLTVQWEGRQDAAVASPTTDLHRSAFRIHVFR